ncbi:MAG: MBL fold metallo-hydrolase [Clostridia bacterium]|nr:MBL fold metallo-hydrolase [Clostridia bacterium]
MVFCIVVLSSSACAAGWKALDIESGYGKTLIDHINHPETEPDFSLDMSQDILEVAFPKIKECDAALLRFQGETMLIDCGEVRQVSAVQEMLSAMHVTNLSSVLITHPHPDHAGGLRTLAETMPIGKIYVCFPHDENAVMQEVIAVSEQYDIPVVDFGDEDDIPLGELNLHAYIKVEKGFTVNNRSPLLRLQYGERVMHFASDMERLALRKAGNEIPPEMLKTEILKYPHHGKDPLVHEYWIPTALELTVITSDHATRNGKVDVIQNKHWPCLFTYDGMILIRSDGKSWLVERLEDDGYSQAPDEAPGKETTEDGAIVVRVGS